MLKVADETWIATALLHREVPLRHSFSIGEIVARAAREGAAGDLRPGVQIHAQQHCVANVKPNGGRYRMLYAPAGGGRRLFRPGDDFHPYRNGAKTTPEPGSIPDQYQELLTWYDAWCEQRRSIPASAAPAATDPTVQPLCLDAYFRAPLTGAALEAYSRKIGDLGWPIRSKLALYGYGKRATTMELSWLQRLAAYSRVYEELKSYWQVFRPLGARDCWEAERILKEFETHAAAWGRQSGPTLLTLGASPSGQRSLLQALEAFRELKPNLYYPWMPVSKTLHFLNPTLIPIYDTAVVWKEVLAGAFADDYRTFCRRAGIAASERSARFNLNYMRLGNRLLSQADAEFMPTFTAWFRSEVGGASDEAGVLDDLETYYATAFEFVIIGAAQLAREKAKGSTHA